MTAGITIWNDEGRVQIDEANANLFLRHAGTVTTSPPGSAPANPFSQGTVTFAATTPMLAIKPNGQYALGYLTNNGDGTWTATIYTQSTTGVSVQYFIFDRPWGADSFGLEISDASGNVVFDAGLLPCKVSGLIQGADYTADNLLTTPEDIASDDSAFVNLKVASYFSQTYTGSNPFPGSYIHAVYHWSLGAKIASSQLQFDEVVFTNANVGFILPVNHLQHQKQYGFLIIDTDGLPTTM